VTKFIARKIMSLQLSSSFCWTNWPVYWCGRGHTSLSFLCLTLVFNNHVWFLKHLSQT